MNFFDRLKYFIYGVFLGLILVICLFGNRIKSYSFFSKKTQTIKIHN